MTDDFNDAEKKIVRLIREATPEKPPASQSPGHTIRNGQGVVVVGDNAQVTVSVGRARAPARRIVPPPGSVDARQKFALQQLVDAIVQDSGRTHAFVWRAFKTRFQVNSYHELPAERFDDAHEYLRQWRGAANNGRG